MGVVKEEDKKKTRRKKKTRFLKCDGVVVKQMKMHHDNKKRGFVEICYPTARRIKLSIKGGSRGVVVSRQKAKLLLKPNILRCRLLPGIIYALLNRGSLPYHPCA